MSENIHILVDMLPVILWFAPIVFASCYGMSAIQSGSWQRRPYSNKEMIFSQPKAVLVVENISNRETERILTDKIVDNTAIGVAEVWVVRPDARTVEMLTLMADGPQTVATYSESDAVQSITFPALSVPFPDIFAS